MVRFGGRGILALYNCMKQGWPGDDVEVQAEGGDQANP